MSSVLIRGGVLPFPDFRDDARFRRLPPLPWPLCTPNSTQRHPIPGPPTCAVFAWWGGTSPKNRQRGRAHFSSSNPARFHGSLQREGISGTLPFVRHFVNGNCRVFWPIILIRRLQRRVAAQKGCIFFADRLKRIYRPARRQNHARGSSQPRLLTLGSYTASVIYMAFTGGSHGPAHSHFTRLGCPFGIVSDGRFFAHIH